jgi:hypothetical protein
MRTRQKRGHGGRTYGILVGADVDVKSRELCDLLAVDANDGSIGLTVMLQNRGE